MRTSFFILIVILSVCSGCGRSFHLRESAELGASSQGTVIAETWQGDAFMDTPFCKICLQQHGSTNLEVLFTVVYVFQESQPGCPHLVITNGVETIQDSAQSYIYSLASRSFITNVWSGSTYTGNFRPDKPRD